MRPHTSYLICATPRSGSTLLCDALSDTGLAGRPKEYFRLLLKHPENRKAEVTFAYSLERALEQGTTPNGVFGTKLMWDHFSALIDAHHKGKEQKNTNVVKEFLAEMFPNPRYIWLTRDDKVRQAISLDIAMQTGIIRWTGNRPVELYKPTTFNFNRLNYLYHLIVAHDNSWQRYFIENRIVPFKVVYEEFVPAYKQTVMTLLRYVGIDVPRDLTLPQPKQKQLATVRNDEWASEYKRIVDKDGAELSRIHRLLVNWHSTYPEPGNSKRTRNPCV